MDKGELLIRMKNCPGCQLDGKQCNKFGEIGRVVAVVGLGERDLPCGQTEELRKKREELGLARVSFNC